MELTILEAAKIVLDITGSKSKIAFTKRGVDDPERRCPSIELARKILGWRPKTPLTEGLRRTVSWVKYFLDNQDAITHNEKRIPEVGKLEIARETANNEAGLSTPLRRERGNPRYSPLEVLQYIKILKNIWFCHSMKRHYGLREAWLLLKDQWKPLTKKGMDFVEVFDNYNEYWASGSINVDLNRAKLIEDWFEPGSRC